MLQIQHLTKYTEPKIVAPSFSGLMQDADTFASALSTNEARTNVYYTLAHHAAAGEGETPTRRAATFVYQTVIAFDVDGVTDANKAAPEDWAKYLKIVADTLKTTPESLTIIDSGNGLHIIAQLKEPIRKAEYFKKNKAHYTQLCEHMTRRLKANQLSGEFDTAVFDAARILRMPGTINVKPGRPDKEAKLLHYAPHVISLDLAALSGLGDFEKDNIPLAEVRVKYPDPDTDQIIKECAFIAQAMAHPEKLHEPDAFDVFSILAQCGTKGRELSEGIFKAATASASLARTDFDKKWEQANRYGCRRCDTIARKFACSACPHYGKIPTPLALKSQEHIGSEKCGYWIYNAKGFPVEPNHADLFKVMQKERQICVMSGERVMSWNGTHYIETPEHAIYKWMHEIMSPSDLIRQRHRGEFYDYILANGYLSAEREAELFIKSTHGKLNCRNGVLDIKTGRLDTHSHDCGFRYVLPHDYHPDAGSEYFLDWLDEISMHRDDVMGTILDMMAYCLWPEYDDHVFAVMVGEGANGKSTILHIIQALVGRSNYAAVSLTQLSSNRFMAAELEGKLVNVAGEASGKELGYEQLNMIKALSAGDEIVIERKNKQPYQTANTAKLFFSANKVPQFAERDRAIKRRLLVLPFDYQIKDTNPNIEKRLLSEISGILAMLIARIQTKMAEDGKFVVTRNSHAIIAAQKRVLLEGNTASQWFEDCIQVTNDDKDFVGAQQMYAHYTQWCAANGVKFAQSNRSFGMTLTRDILNRISVTRWVGSMSTRGYAGIKLITQ